MRPRNLTAEQRNDIDNLVDCAEYVLTRLQAKQGTTLRLLKQEDVVRLTGSIVRAYAVCVAADKSP